MTFFTDFVAEAEGTSGSCDVTLYSLVLGDRDGVTGWREKTFTPSTIKMVIDTKGRSELALKAGTYVRYDALGFTNTAVEEGDEVKTSGGTYYEVKSATPIYKFTPDTIEFYSCDLTKLPLHEV